MASRIEQLNKAIQEGIGAVQEEEFLKGLNLLAEGYSGQVESVLPDGLSYYGLCLALIQKKFKPAIDLCRKAIELQFYNPAHYANLSRVYVAAENRKRALEAVEQGLKIFPDDELLMQVRAELGVRSRPAVPFLPRESAVNKAIGRTLHAKKSGEKPAKKKRK